MMDLIYNEIGDREERELKEHLSECSSCRQDLEELQGTRDTLKQWPDSEAKVTLVFAERQTKTVHAPRPLWQQGLRWTASAAAVLLVMLSLVSIRYSSSNGNVQFSMGWFSSPAQTDNSQFVTKEELQQSQREQILYTSSMIDEKYREQSTDNYTMINELVEGLETQRREDLEVILTSFSRYQQSNNEKIYRTNQNFLDLLKYTGVEIQRGSDE